MGICILKMPCSAIYVLQSYFCPFMAAVRVDFRGLHLPFCMQLQEVTSTYECKFNCLFSEMTVARQITQEMLVCSTSLAAV